MRKKLLFLYVLSIVLFEQSAYAADVFVQYRSEPSQMLVPELEYKQALVKLLPHTGEVRGMFFSVLGGVFLLVALFLVYRTFKEREEENEI